MIWDGLFEPRILDSTPGAAHGWRAVLAVAAILLTARALGRRMARRGEGELVEPVPGVNVAAGLAALQVLVLIAGQVPWFLGDFAIPAIACLMAGFGVRDAISGWVEGRRNPAPSYSFGSPELPEGSFGRLMRVLQKSGWYWTAIVAASLLGPAFASPVNYDSLEYHIAAPMEWLGFPGVIRPLPGNFYTAQPLATESLWTLAMALEGSRRGYAPGLLQWCMALTAGTLLAGLLRRRGAPPAAIPWLIAAAAIHPVFFKLNLDRLTDLTGALFFLGGLAALDRADGPGSPAPQTRFRLWALAGAFAGAAVAVKWTNAGTSFVMLAFAGAAYAGFLGRLRGPKFALACVGLAAAGFALTLGPWLIWLGLRTGNPFSPFLAGVFPTPAWGPEQLSFLMETHGRLSFFSAEYFANLFSRMQSREFATNWLKVVLLWSVATAAFGVPKSRGFAPLLAGAVAAVALWGGLAHAAGRFLAPVFAAAILLAGQTMGRFSRLGQPGGWRDLVLVLFAMLAALPGLPLVPLLHRPPYARLAERAFAGPEVRREAAESIPRWAMGSTLDFHRAAQPPPGKRLLLYGEARKYYLGAGPDAQPPGDRIVLATVFDKHPLIEAARGAGSPEAILRRLRRAGFGRLAVNEYEIARLLRFHPPPEAAAALAEIQGDEPETDGERVRRFPAALNGGAALPPADREALEKLLESLRAGARIMNPAPGGRPAYWIAELGE